MQKFVSQPSEILTGVYKVARWNELSSKYEELNTIYLSEEDAKDAARQLNKDYEEEHKLEREYERKHQDELIDKYHSFAISGNIQQKNAAIEFFTRFPYQRDVCDEILKQMKDY